MARTMGLTGRLGLRAAFGLLALGALWLTLGTGRADASITLTPSTIGAGSITMGAGNTSPGYGGCDKTGNQNDSVESSCGTAGIASGSTTACFPFIGCITLPANTTLVLQAIPAPAPAGHWSFVRWDGCDVAVGDLCSISNIGIGDLSYAPRAVFNDSVGPTMSAATPVYSTTTDRGVSFSPSANEVLSAAQCRVDGGAFAPCSSVRQVAEGTHTVQAQGTDRSGNLGAISGTLATFRILDTKLLSGPTDFSSVKRPTFKYSTLAGSAFQCRLYSQGSPAPAFGACGTKNAAGEATFTPPTDLADGVKVFEVRSVDGPEFDRVPLVRTWRVDTVAPVVSTFNSPTIADGVVTTGLNATFNFAATEVGGLERFECKLDGENFAPCTSPKAFANLPFGQHAFSVRGLDKAGNLGATVSRSWTIVAQDNDGDGFDQRSDCNDGNPGINPIAFDVPDNGVDENCDGADSIDLDRDRDGFPRPADCNDGNARIHPGVRDIPDNNVDENCDGSDAKTPPLPQNAALVSYSFDQPQKAFTKFTLFQVKNIPTGSKIVITCKKCPKKAHKITKSKAKGVFTVKQLKTKVPAGTAIVVRVTKPGTIGIVKIVAIRKKKNPKLTTKCLQPGASKPTSCAK
jgi:hypothetical protein